MNRKIPVILVLMLLTGSLVNAHSPQYSEKLRLGPKKIFSRVQGESGSGKVGYKRDFEPHKGTIAPGTLVDPYGYITHYGYDGYDRISKITDPLNNITLLGRANTGNLLSLKQLDPTGQQILLQSIRINDPAGRLKSYTIKMPNPDDDITYTRTYEENGKRIIFKDPLERQTVVQLNDDGKVDTVTDAAGNSIKYYYEDGRGNATKKEETVKSADGTKTETYFTEYKYNAHNQVETITDVQTQAVTTFTYDLKGNLTGTLDAEGNSITHEYDELGRRTKTIQYFSDKTLKPVETKFEYYPAMGKDPETGEVVYSPSNRIKSITDDKGNKTTYEYDYRNRVKKVIYPDLTFTEYTYDKTATGASNSSGNPTYYRLVVEKQRNGTVVTNYYDQLHRLMKREIAPAEGSAGTTIETFTYDELSRLKHATDDDTALDYQFDRASRMDWEKQAGKLIDYTYNKLSNLTDLKYPNTKLIEMQYDQLNRMNLIKEDDFTIADMIHIGRSYRLLRKQYGNGDLITYLYDQGRRLQDLEAKNLNNNSLINHYRYGYNKINLKTYEQRLHNAGKGDAYGYDALYRLTNVKFNATDPLNPTEFEREKSINYNNLHTIISMIESFNGQTRTIDTEIPDGSDYSKLNQHARFDQWGLEYDRNGNLKQKGTQRFTHDYRNQLISAVDGTLSVDMKYDVMGRRVQKAVTKGNQTEVRNYYYAGHQLIEERDGNDQVTRQYIYGNGIDEIIRMDKYQGTAVTSYYFHTDSIGSITAITDSQGNLVERVTYDIYGMPTFWDPAGNKIPESLIGNTILFQGREYDPELNLYQGFNMNPANFNDPFGLRFDNDFDPNIIPGMDPSRAANIMNAARNASGELAATAAICFAISPLSAPAIIALSGSTLIYTGLDEYSERVKAGQSPYEAKAGTIVNKLTLGTYSIIKGRDPGTGDKIQDEERAAMAFDTFSKLVSGAVGFISRNVFSSPSTFELIDETFNELASNKASGDVGIFNKSTEFTPSTQVTYKVFQRSDIDWGQIRTAGPREFIGKTNAEAARAGYRPQLPDGSFVTIHHSQQNAKGPWFEASTRYHNITNAQKPPLHPYKGEQHPYFPLGKGSGSLREQFQTVESQEYWIWRERNR